MLFLYILSFGDAFFGENVKKQRFGKNILVRDDCLRYNNKVCALSRRDYLLYFHMINYSGEQTNEYTFDPD